MTIQSGAPDLGSLFQSAHEEGDLSAQSLRLLNVVDVGQQIQAGIGISALDIQASEVILVAVMPDDSASILHAGNAQVVRDGHNLVKGSLMGSKQRNSVMFTTRYLNGLVLNPWCRSEEHS